MSGKARKLQGHDSFQRINYLYQISKLMARDNNNVLSAYYGNQIINVAKKNVQRIHPEIKRQLCKKCRNVLIDNCSATTKVKTIRQTTYVIWTCKTCKTKKKLPSFKNKDNRVWVEKPEAVVEVLDYNIHNK